MEPWLLSIKRVGGQDMQEGKNFTVSVSPDDTMTSLFSQIESVTGLKASQQRLIYRGRIINHQHKKNASLSASLLEGDGGEQQQEEEEIERKIGDVTGLGDGHTIHLVPKSDSLSSSSNLGDTNHSSVADNDPPLSGTGTASLLAALLGLSGDDDNDALEEESSPSLLGGNASWRRRRWGSSAMNRNRRANYRLTADDITGPEPGSMEPVRQGLMTLCTMVDSQQSATPNPSPAVAQLREPPSAASRTWYRGQWLDCLDTVNQWLEATIVDIVHAEDVLPTRLGNRERGCNPSRQNSSSSQPDATVNASDFEGRRKLLLEPCNENDSDEEDGELAGFRERANNAGVQLLLIHYNGWPHRWDEWIRSDSERIRPFRTRTRHPNSAPFTSPSPQSIFHAAPTTYIKDEDDNADRSALLPELSRALSAVNGLLVEAVPSIQSGNTSLVSTVDDVVHSALPWLDHSENQENQNDEPAPVVPFEPNQSDISQILSDGSESGNIGLNRQQLEALAPLLDRLGRTLTDAAPHIAALAASLPKSGCDANNCRDPSISDDHSEELRDDALGTSTGSGLFSLLSPESRLRANPDSLPPSSLDSIDTERTNPDHADFVNGMVNTFRGEDRNSRRERSEDGTSLLGAYLAAASLSNLVSGGASDNNNAGGASGVRLRQGIDMDSGGDSSTGAGGAGGIDIHIHAIVTGPGVGQGGMGVTMLGGGGGAIPTPLPTLGSNRHISTMPPLTPLIPLSNHDDMGLFSELYSENPQPYDLYAERYEDGENAGEDTDLTTGNLLGDRTTYPFQTDRLVSSPFGHDLERSASTRRRSGRRRGSIGRWLGRAIGRRHSSTRPTDLDERPPSRNRNGNSEI